MHFEAQRFHHFVLLAAFLSALSFYLGFSPQFATLEHINLKHPWSPKHKSNYAYATFLGPPTSQSLPLNTTTATRPNFQTIVNDPYFLSVRLLTYQILHAPTTRTKLHNTPFLVLVLPTVPSAQIDVLRREGATIVHIEPLDLPKAFNREFVENSRFRDVLAKLRLWELVKWEKVLYLDADSFLLQYLDDIFTDNELSATQRTLPREDDVPSILADDKQDGQRDSGVEEWKEPEPPETYLMAASTDTYGDQTPWEDSPDIHPAYLCACFMLFAPSLALFSYYTSMLSQPHPPPELQDAYYPEQDLLIYVHRVGGRMPWRRIPVTWSANDDEMNDEYALKGGVRSLHVKGWDGAVGGNVAGEKYRGVWRGLVGEMEGFWKERAEDEAG